MNRRRSWKRYGTGSFATTDLIGDMNNKSGEKQESPVRNPMFREFFGFSENPFNLTPNPSFLFNHNGYDDVCSSIEFGIKERKGIMVITGEVGTGKTTFIHTLLKELGEKIKTAFIFNPKLTFKQLLETVHHELKIPAAGKSTSSILGGLNKFLKERMAAGENVLIVIDEGQCLANKVLKDLDRLYQQLPSGVNALQTLLVGQLELETKLNSEELREFKQRVAIQKQIRLLDLQESRQYIDHRLKVVGSSSSKVFTPEAVEVICEYAKGIPRVINLICDGALFAGYEASAPVIDDHMVKKAIAENEITIEKAPRQKALFAIGCLLVVILFGLTLALFRSDRPRQSATQETLKEQPSQAGGGTEPVKEHSVAGVAPSAAKRQLHSREAGTGSVPSLQRKDPGREQSTKVSKKARARSERIGGQKPIGQAGLSGSSEQSMTDSLPQGTGPIETGKVLHESGEFSSGDQKASASEISRTAEESQEKEAEEIDSGKAIDWLLEKRSEKKNQE